MMGLTTIACISIGIVILISLSRLESVLIKILAELKGES